MDKELLIKIGIGVAIGTALLLIANSMFGKGSEEYIIKKYGKYFNSGYWKSEIKRMYKSDFKEWRAKGASEQDIYTYIIDQYFDRDRLKNIAQIIHDSKGTFSDDEEEALVAFSKLTTYAELSFLTTIYSTLGDYDEGKNSPYFDLLTNPMSVVMLAYQNGQVKNDDVTRNLLSYTLTYFNKSHRKALGKILGKLKRAKKKYIKPPIG